MDEMLLGVMVVSKSLTHVSFAYSPEGLCAVNTARKIIDSIGNRPEDTYIKLEQVWTSTLIQQRIGRKSVEVNNALKLLEVLNWITLHDEGSNNLKFMPPERSMYPNQLIQRDIAAPPLRWSSNVSRVNILVTFCYV